MLYIEEMVRRLTELAFETNDENLLAIVDIFEAADEKWNETRTMINKVYAENAYKALRKAYQTLVQGV